jgi:hypothetical protein
VLVAYFPMNHKRSTALLTRGILLAVVILGGVALLLGVGRQFFTSAPAPTATPAANAGIYEVPTPPPLNSPTGPAPSPGSYVTLSGQNFVVGQTVLQPYGSTMYPHWSHQGYIVKGEGWAKPDFPQYIDHILSLALQAHLNVIRATNFFDGITYGDWYNATVWANMDYLFQQAAAHHLYVLLDLSSFRDKTLKQGIYPYDPAAFSAAFTWVARRYARTTNLLNYAIAGEVSCPSGNDALRPTSTDDLTNFYRVLSDALYAGDPYHLISAGGLSHLNQSDCGIDWKSIYSLPHIRIAAIHVYSDNDRTITMPMVSAWADGRAEPFTVEEFGFVQGASDETRAAEYEQMYALGKQYHVTTMIFWNLGDELASTSYEVNPNTPLTWQVVVQNAPPASAPGAQLSRGAPASPPGGGVDESAPARAEESCAPAAGKGR